MDNRWKNRIIQAMRRLSFSYPPRANAKRASKVDKATYECNYCGTYIYDGKSDKNYNEIKANYPDKNVIMDKTCIDHIVPVRDSGTEFTWDTFLEGLFCGEDNLQTLCKPCHKIKTKDENKLRVVQRKK